MSYDLMVKIIAWYILIASIVGSGVLLGQNKFSFFTFFVSTIPICFLCLHILKLI